MPEFKKFPKLHRLFRDITITEKIDGTNACVVIPEYDGTASTVGPYSVHAQSRKRLITPEQDNFGFAKWVQEHAEELVKLGPGYHYGEWWGKGIQRGYDLDERRFSLFNPETEAPECCSTVPILYRGEFNEAQILKSLLDLQVSGSIASPGFENPEGIVVYHHHGRHSYKITLDNEDRHKWEVS